MFRNLEAFCQRTADAFANQLKAHNSARASAIILDWWDRGKSGVRNLKLADAVFQEIAEKYNKTVQGNRAVILEHKR